MKNSKLLILFVLCCMIFACHTNEGILNIDSNQLLVGYRNATYIIGKTGEQDIDVRNWIDRQVFFYFDEKNKLEWVSIVSPAFRTKKGIKVGDSLASVRAIYGTPTHNSVYVHASGVPIGTFAGLFYDSLIFWPDSTNTNIRTIMFGNHGIYKQSN